MQTSPCKILLEKLISFDTDSLDYYHNYYYPEYDNVPANVLNARYIYDRSKLYSTQFRICARNFCKILTRCCKKLLLFQVSTVSLRSIIILIPASWRIAAPVLVKC